MACLATSCRAVRGWLAFMLGACRSRSGGRQLASEFEKGEGHSLWHIFLESLQTKEVEVPLVRLLLDHVPNLHTNRRVLYDVLVVKLKGDLQVTYEDHRLGCREQG